MALTAAQKKYIQQTGPQLDTLLAPYHDVFRALSVATYEKAPCRGYLTFSKDAFKKAKKDISVIFFHTFEILPKENIRLLRKLLEGTHSSRHLLVMNPLVLNPLPGPPPAAIAFGLGALEEEDTLCTVRFTGPLAWQAITLHRGVEYRFALGEEGKYAHQPTQAGEKEFISKMKKLFGFAPDKAGNDTCARWEKIYRAIAERNQHGTMLVVLEEKHAWEETDRLAKANRGIKLGKRVGNDPPLIGALTSIDGSLLYDFWGVIYGYGYILDGIAYYKGRSDKGARYNSALTYVATQKKAGKKALACVFSEDGGSLTISTKDALEPV